jgi:transglutaminase-like putative cysteine protease
LTWNLCSHDCTAPIETAYDLVSKLIVQSPDRIPDAAFSGSIRYVIARPDGKSPQMPVTSEQAVVVSGSKLIVTVCASCEAVETLSATERDRYLRPNPWVQSDAPEIRDFATRRGGGGTTIDVMNRLVDAVRDHMEGGNVDYLGPAGALQALRTRSGDCIEYAVLLGALARAKNIPTRIVYGLVYADRFSGKKDVFSPHAWVQAWTGTRWQSFDAGIGHFDATHLALRIGDGDPHEADDGFMGPADVRIENLGRVR